MKQAVPRMSDEDLKAFVMGYCDGRIVTSSMLPDNLLHMVFMPLALGGVNGFDTKTIGLVWEWANARGAKMAVNGWPMFPSLRLMHKDDVARAQKAIDRELVRRKRVKV